MPNLDSTSFCHQINIFQSMLLKYFSSLKYDLDIVKSSMKALQVTNNKKIILERECTFSSEILNNEKSKKVYNANYTIVPNCYWPFIAFLSYEYELC